MFWALCYETDLYGDILRLASWLGLWQGRVVLRPHSQVGMEAQAPSQPLVPGHQEEGSPHHLWAGVGVQLPQVSTDAPELGEVGGTGFCSSLGHL